MTARPEPKVRGEWALRWVESGLLRLEQLSSRLLPDSVNPLLHTGAIANTLLLVAIATGGLLLLWYSPSVHFAHSSMVQIEASLLPSLVRSLHRYSSDACMLFVALHALRLTAARRFTGARWLAWVTGLAAVGFLWVVGWLGYWLVWDERARQVAIGTARFLDRLPVFGDPLEGAFLADATVNSLLFFIIFFIHMLIPLLMGVALWLHIARLQRPDFLTSRVLGAAVCVALGALSIALPARVASAAQMGVFPRGFDFDGWYLLPLWLTDRWAGGSLWLLVTASGIGLFAAPWLVTRKRAPPATIVTERCNACEHCVQDCPYEAISLVPRTDGKPYALQAQVDPSRCVGCGICNGSCATAGSGLPSFDTLVQRDVGEAWLEAAPTGAPPMFAYLCDDAMARELQVDPATGECAQLPGYRVMRVPCAGWVHAITVERLLRKGAPGVLIAACAGNCRFREGPKWTSGRIAGTHDTPLSDRADHTRVRVVETTRVQQGKLISEAAAFRASTAPAAASRLPVWAGAPLMAVVLGALTFAGSVLPYRPPQPVAPRLAISFKHPGVIAEKCRTLSADEQASQPAHMRRTQECKRGRQPVRMRLSVDGATLLTRSYAAAGLWGDGSSVALEELDVPAGRHEVSVEIGDTADENEWAYRGAHAFELAVGTRHTILFDRTAGFSWH